MNAVERVLHYAELPPEEEDQSPDNLATKWPDSGSIVLSLMSSLSIVRVFRFS